MGVEVIGAQSEWRDWPNCDIGGSDYRLSPARPFLFL